MSVHKSRKTLHPKDRKWFQRTIVWGLFVIGLEIVATVSGAKRFPHLSDIFVAIVATVTNGDLVTLMGTWVRMLAGFILACAVGVPIGLLMGGIRLVDHLFRSYFNALLVTSLEALIPLFIVFFGTQVAFHIAVVFIFALPFIVLNTAAGVRKVDTSHIEMARAFHASRLQIFVTIILPGTLPYITAGLRLGMGNAIKGSIISELWILVATGAKLTDLGNNHSLPALFALTFWIILTGGLILQGLALLQKRLTPWTHNLRELR